MIPVAAGERIVAFARAGKPPKGAFWGGIEPIPDHAEGTVFHHIETVSKARWG
jgi:hypothetical protein